MNFTTITGQAAVLPDGVPREIVFIPEGNHRITPRTHPQGISVNLPAHRGLEIAARFQRGLEGRLQNNVKPWLDFEHTRKFPAAGYPTAFRYEAGRGIIATIEWSGSGETAIKNKDVRYFSPEFHLDGDGTPLGIPENGPIGGLVTEPAFRDIQPVAASDSDTRLSAYARVEAHFAAELGDEDKIDSSLDHRKPSSDLSPYDKISAHFAAELGEI